LTVRSIEQYRIDLRDRLIEAAIRQFGELGFDGASTRAIASGANTTMSNITYHFGSKRGLFCSAEVAIASRLGQVVTKAIAEVLSSDASNAQRLDQICGVLRRIGTFMLTDEAKPMALFVSREQQNPQSIIRKYMRREFNNVADIFAREIRQIRTDLSYEGCRMIVFFLFRMAVFLRSSRLSLCVFMDVEDINQEMSKALLARLDGIARGAICGEPV